MATIAELFAALDAAVTALRTQLLVPAPPPVVPPVVPVPPVVLGPLVVMPAAKTLAVGATFQLTATNGGAIAWNSNDHFCASVSATGLVTAVKAGLCLIHAVRGAEDAYCVLTVVASTAPPPVLPPVVSPPVVPPVIPIISRPRTAPPAPGGGGGGGSWDPVALYANKPATGGAWTTWNAKAGTVTNTYTGDTGSDLTLPNLAAPQGAGSLTTITRTSPVSPDDNGTPFAGNEVAGFSLNRENITDAGAPLAGLSIFRQVQPKGSGGGGGYGPSCSSPNPPTAGGGTYQEAFYGYEYKIELNDADITGAGFSATNYRFPDAGSQKNGYMYGVGTVWGTLMWLEMNYDGAFTAPFGNPSIEVVNQAGDTTVVFYPNITTTKIEPGVTYKVEAYYKLATSLAANDGIVRVWINGVLNIDVTNARTRGSEDNQRMEGLHLNSQFGGQVNVLTTNSVYKLQGLYSCFR